jgi:hypothetical protein
VGALGEEVLLKQATVIRGSSNAKMLETHNGPTENGPPPPPTVGTFRTAYKTTAMLESDGE